ncbi:MAG: tRNA 2-thiocytidine(32) synthetase TtcA, partial [Proteobacteria bacterium]|nr:tRNA 2-thiocytidine(32) synthetase TtcA [Candidatus Avisuccinivibrio stercorigallinarum]
MQYDQTLSAQADAYARTVSPYFDIEDKESKYKADKLFKRLRRKVGHAIGDYGMIEPGDRVM